MFRKRCILFILSVVLSRASTVYSQCITVKDQSGTISYSGKSYSTYKECWTIHVSENQFLTLRDIQWSMYSLGCSYAYIRIQSNGTNEKYTICGSDTNQQNSITALSDVRIDFYFQNINYRKPSFSLRYELKGIECARKSSFHCSKTTCIPKSKVCDKVKDCENGLDEANCDYGVLGVTGVVKARDHAISWLKSKRTLTWGWHENSPRAVTALFLSNGANFNGTSLDEELMVKQSETKIAIGLLKNPISNELLSMYINSLLVTCHSPRHFYGQNLVKRLRGQMESPSDFTHPIAYLTLCNSNTTWPQRAPNDLLKVLNSSSDYHFVKDIQSYAVMAVSCYSNNPFISNKIDTTNLFSQVNKTLETFESSQLSDGSFGNVQTTALVTQALIASGRENSKTWNLKATVNYLMKELNSTDLDFTNVYFTLPLFNGKSLSDIYKVNCTGNPRRVLNGNIKNEIDDYIGPKMRVQYSLFVGDEKDLIHTISLRVPENYTAYQVMRYADEEDYKYKFEWKMISNKIYVYKIGKVLNDPDVGKFWLMYLGSSNSTNYMPKTSSPDKIILKEEDHLVMWYKTVSI